MDTPLYNQETNTYINTKVHMDQVLTKLIGCPQIPREKLAGGLVEFDHKAKTSKINTCAPSITFNALKLNSYNTFKADMLSLIFDDDGFGLE